MTKKFGAWRSPVAHHNGVVGVAGSNPVVPTLFRRHIKLYHFAGHKAERNPSFDTIACCWDVDRLDIRRVGLELDLQWYNTEAEGYMIINKDFR